MFPECKKIGCHSAAIVGTDYCACCQADMKLQSIIDETNASRVEIQAANEAEYTGSSVSYYTAPIRHPVSGGAPYAAECVDIVETLDMNFAEGNAFKAIWRLCAARTLDKKKKGYTDGVYDAEKVVFYGERMLAQETRKAENEESA